MSLLIETDGPPGESPSAPPDTGPYTEMERNLLRQALYRGRPTCRIAAPGAALMRDAVEPRHDSASSEAVARFYQRNTASASTTSILLVFMARPCAPARG